MEKKKIILFVVIAILIVILGVGVAAMLSERNDETLDPNIEAKDEEKVNEDEEVVEESAVKIFNEKSNERPIAYMIDNNRNAQPQSSINKAFVVYEIIVEGNETRLMAIFKGLDEATVGPIRSARHYFLDYAAEYDAIYAHLGLSPKADDDMKMYGTNNINGQIYDTGAARNNVSIYWRSSERKAPHNAYTSIETIKRILPNLGYKDTTTKGTPLNYSVEEITLDSEDAIVATDVEIPYGGGHLVNYKYDEETGRYTRYSKGRKQSDYESKEDATTKNLIITFAKNTDLPDTENKGRQDVHTTGTLDGYYVTNGKAIKIQCVKETRQSQTKYLDLEGNEIKINDGNTWINICPINADVTFE